MRLRQYGARAVLADVADHRVALGLYEQWRRDPVDGVVDIVPAATTVLVTFTDAGAARRGAAVLAARLAEGLAEPLTEPVATLPTGPVVELPVIYDGADLHEVARRTGLSADDVIARHSAADYTVAFIGFAPGFAYLTGLDPALHVARRDSPRTRVPPGSVAVAGEFSAVYPNASPGGWQLLGRSDAALWDPHRDPPALLGPGTRVRFVRVVGAPGGAP